MRTWGRMFGRGSGFTTFCPRTESGDGSQTGQRETWNHDACKKPLFGLQTTTLPLLFPILAFFFFLFFFMLFLNTWLFLWGRDKKRTFSKKDFSRPGQIFFFLYLSSAQMRSQTLNTPTFSSSGCCDWLWSHEASRHLPKNCEVSVLVSCDVRSSSRWGQTPLGGKLWSPGLT